MKELICGVANMRGFFIDFDLVSTKLGRSLMSKEFVKAGSIIWEDTGMGTITASKEDILMWPENQRVTFCDYSWQEDENLFRGTYIKEDIAKDPSNFINHSCDPSCWFVTDRHISARRDIYPGDEITIDYATTDTIFLTIPECMCESSNCRGAILPTDYKLPHVQKTYVNHFRLYLLRRMLHEGIADNETDRGVGLMHELHKSVGLYESHIHGKGLYAARSIPAETVVWEANEQQDDIWIELDETQGLLQERDFYPIVVSYFEMNERGNYRGPKFAESIERDASNYFNHSCEPNLWFAGDDRLVAMRDIEVGVELTYDYCTAKRLYTKKFTCRCGAKNCRKDVTYEDYKLPHLRQKYRDHWVSHWLKLMALETQDSPVIFSTV